MENVSRRKAITVRKAPRTKAKVREKGKSPRTPNANATTLCLQPVVVDVHLKSSLKSTRPSVSPEEHLRLSRMWVGSSSPVTHDSDPKLSPDMPLLSQIEAER